MSRSTASTVLHWLLIAVALVGPLGYLHEVSDRTKQDSLFSDALMSANAGRWVWDLEAEKAGRDSLVWDDQMFVLFGRDRKHWTPNWNGFESCLILEDRARIREVVNSTIAAKGGYNAVFTVIMPDGAQRIMRASGKISRNGRYMSGLVLPSMQDPAIEKENNP